MDQSEVSRRGFLESSAVLAGGAAVTWTDTASAQDGGPVFRDVQTVRMRVNGRELTASIEARVSLLDYLRERADLTGTKKGCNEGACGACTVLLDGRRVNACLTLAAQCDGREVVTAEGLSPAGGPLHPVQQAFIDHDAFQCGYCTPGQVVSAAACVAEGHAVDEPTVREWMSGNLCRCSAYPQITAAVLDAAARMGRPPARAGVNPSVPDLQAAE